MAEINVQAIVDEWGARYTPEGQTAKDIKTQLFAPSETEAFFTKVPNQGDYYKSSFANVDEVTQAFSIPFKTKGNLVFKPWETRMGEFKIDSQMKPDKVRNSWLGFLANITEVDRTKWPIIGWFIQMMLIPKVQEEMEEEISFYGWQITGYDAVPTVNGATLVREFASDETVTPANAAMDGIKVQRAKMIAASRATVIATGALSADAVTFTTQVETFVQNVEPKLRRKLDFLFMSEENANLYMDGVREKYNKYHSQIDDILMVKNSKIKVQPLHSMVGSDVLWATPADNRKLAYDVEKPAKFDVQKDGRAVHILSDWKKTLAFDVPEFFVTNDLETTITAGDITERY